jgi:hypothetical protein
VMHLPNPCTKNKINNKQVMKPIKLVNTRLEKKIVEFLKLEKKIRISIRLFLPGLFNCFFATHQKQKSTNSNPAHTNASSRKPRIIRIIIKQPQNSPPSIP